jgi:formamidopyrimidine-DNA glycosylase
VPELPDVTVYVEALRPRVVGQALRRFECRSPFVLRSVIPSPAELEGRPVTGVDRLGKRIVIGLEGDVFVVIHLMIAGRLRWLEAGEGGKGRGRTGVPSGKLGLASFAFDRGTLWLTEAGTKRRASIHLAAGGAALAEFDRGGLEVLDASLEAFAGRLRSENHTLKRALADPRLFSGIGNAYSDEILHRARLSPLQLTSRLDDAGVERL